MIIAGIGQLTLALGSLWIPGLLGWRQETKRLEPLTRAVFWTYASYIWAAHVCFALVSILKPDLLLDGSSLARLVTGFISAWWGVRLVLQWPFRKLGPKGLKYQLGEAALTITFFSCFIFYAAVALRGLS